MSLCEAKPQSAVTDETGLQPPINSWGSSSVCSLGTLSQAPQGATRRTRLASIATKRINDDGRQQQ